MPRPVHYIIGNGDAGRGRRASGPVRKAPDRSRPRGGDKRRRSGTLPAAPRSRIDCDRNGPRERTPRDDI